MIENSRGIFPARPAFVSSGDQAARASMLDLEFSEQSDAGKVRHLNEDAHGHVAPVSPAEKRSHGWLFALADGVGGHARGEVASRLAVNYLLEGFRKCCPGEPHNLLMARLAKEANLRVYEAGRSGDLGGARMATTLVACALRYDRAVITHVGDSRCYLIRRSRPTQLTRDHTVANEHLRLGLISAGESTQSSTRHLLLRALGNELFVNVDVHETQVIPGDVLVLCSDGMHGSVEADEMAQIVMQSRDLSDASKTLVRLANERDGSDNITVQVVRIRGVERVGMYRGRPYKLR
jgi:serine/threonine protein phosphatase PrpC